MCHNGGNIANLNLKVWNFIPAKINVTRVMNIPAWSPSSSSSSSSLKCRACLFFFSTLITPAATVTADVADVVVVTERDEVVSDDDVLDGLSVVGEVADSDSCCVSFVDLESCDKLTVLSSDSL